MTHCLRVTLGNNSAKLVSDWLLTKSDLYICVREVGKQNNPHIHAVLAFTKITESSFRQGLKKQFNVNGNSGFSLEKIKKDLQSSIRYCCKGESETPYSKPDVLHCKSDIDVAHLNAEYWDFVMEQKQKREQVIDDLTCTVKSVVKKRAKTWSERVVDVLKNEHTDVCEIIRTYVNQPIKYLSDDEIECYDEARAKVFEIMMKHLGMGCKKLSHRIVEELYEGFINSIVQQDDNVGAEYARKWYKSVFSVKKSG